MSKVMDLQLPSKQKFVLLCIANNSDDFGAAFPSVASLSRDSCIPERTIQRLIGWLIDQNYVLPYWDYHPKDRLRRKKIRYFRLNFSGKPATIRPDYSNCPTALRQEVIQRFNKMCSYCGGVGDDKRGPDKKAWEIDRIIPGSQGGSYIADNVTLSCALCNRIKGAKLAPQEGAKVANLGAILDTEGCQDAQVVVPLVAHYPSDQPSIEPSSNTAALFLNSLKPNPAYSHVDLAHEACKMQAWLSLPGNKHRKFTPRFVLNWLNKIERPLTVSPNGVNGHKIRYEPNDSLEVCLRCHNTGTETTPNGSRYCNHQEGA